MFHSEYATESTQWDEQYFVGKITLFAHQDPGGSYIPTFSSSLKVKYEIPGRHFLILFSVFICSKYLLGTYYVLATLLAIAFQSLACDIVWNNIFFIIHYLIMCQLCKVLWEKSTIPQEKLENSLNQLLRQWNRTSYNVKCYTVESSSRNNNFFEISVVLLAICVDIWEYCLDDAWNIQMFCSSLMSY